jgi:hypothetical protein
LIVVGIDGEFQMLRKMLIARGAKVAPPRAENSRSLARHGGLGMTDFGRICSWEEFGIGEGKDAIRENGDPR